MIRVSLLLLLLCSTICAADEQAALAKRLIIPRAEMHDADFSGAIQWLELKSKELDPAKKGVKFVLRESAKYSGGITFTLSNVSVFDVATRICMAADLQLLHGEGTLLIEGVNREQAPPPDGDEVRIEGAYSSAPDLTGTTLEFKHGRFQFTTWHDVLGTINGETGAYRREGRRIILLGDKPDYVDSVVWAEYDGVALLFLETAAYRYFIEGGVIRRDSVFHRAWKDLDNHPKLKSKLVDQ